MDNLLSLKRKMLVKYPFFGSVVASVTYKENKDIPTAGTDGNTIYYNPVFLQKLSSDEQLFIFAHEVCHIAFNHILRSEGKDQECWNIATDGVINQFLKKDGLKLVTGGVDIEEAINYDAESLYEKLLQKKKQSQDQQQNQENQHQNGGGGQGNDEQQQSQSQQQNSSGGGGSQEQDKQSQEQSGGGSGEDSQEEEKQQDVGHDTHRMWSDAVKKNKEQKKDNSKMANQQENNSSTKENTINEREAFKKNQEEKRKNLEKLKEKISSEAAQAGTTTNMDTRVVHDIGYAKPIIDWRYALREAIKYDIDWSYQNATIEDGVITPHLEEQPMPETEIVLDTSGSVNEILLKSFLRECKNILKYSKLKVGCFDTQFYGFTEIRNEKDIDDMQFIGGGGTSFDAAVNAFSNRVENKIIFTDGEATMPEKALDAIWMVFGNRKINPKGGKVIMITSQQLNELCSYNLTTSMKRTLKKF